MSTETTPQGDQLQTGRATPTRRGRPRITPHPTATTLLETAVALLEEVPADRVTIHMVLERSGISYGSLYHHYENISDLVEQAVVHRYARRLRESLVAVRALLDSTDAADFRRRSEALFDMSILPERRRNRLDRIEALGALQGHPRLAERIALAQQDVTDQQAALYIEFQRRGWMRTDLDPVALSAFVQAMVVGRIVDDVSERPIDGERWSSVALRAFRAIMYPD